MRAARLALGGLAPLAVASAVLAAEGRTPLLGFCAPPPRPACVDDGAAYADPAARVRCDGDMRRFVDSVFAYRQCLNAETERVVRLTNLAIARHKCRMAGGRNCP